jgi:asparagine synthetase B (glutamine-hydrolysing)
VLRPTHSSLSTALHYTSSHCAQTNTHSSLSTALHYTSSHSAQTNTKLTQHCTTLYFMTLCSDQHTAHSALQYIILHDTVLRPTHSSLSTALQYTSWHCARTNTQLTQHCITLYFMTLCSDQHTAHSALQYIILHHTVLRPTHSSLSTALHYTSWHCAQTNTQLTQYCITLYFITLCSDQHTAHSALHYTILFHITKYSHIYNIWNL